MNTLLVRSIHQSEFTEAVRLHQKILHDEFIVRYGSGFMKRYYRAFSESSYAVALVAIEIDTNQVIGTLLGTINPTLHYRFLTRRHGFPLAIHIVVQSLLHMSLARDLMRTRIKRYLTGIFRTLFHKRNISDIPESHISDEIGDITHLFVDTEAQSKGVGTSLLQAYLHLAKKVGVKYVDLVTSPDDITGAGEFYEKLGWELQRKLTSRSGEKFLLYRLDLAKTR